MTDDAPKDPDKKNTGHKYLPGNKFWMARAKHGADRKYEDPNDLWKACLEYFEWNEANPLWEDKVFSYEGDQSHEPMAKMRALTLFGLFDFIDIAESTWHDWRKNRPDLSGIIERVERIIKRQKFEGAAAGLLSHNIIARDLGLADKMTNQMQAMDKQGNPTDLPGAGVMELMATVLAKVKAQE